jgi:hypothetical protein
MSFPPIQRNFHGKNGPNSPNFEKRKRKLKPSNFYNKVSVGSPRI